ncbi:MAG: peroxiredoxin [Candidatus Nitrosocaldaceae archaeon]|nr:MAG: peroxiredoxin [Candidatus Nitrosocaldaceae archaeon]
MKLKVGDPAPDFEAISTKGKIRLSDFRGKKVILYFYVKDQTPGCTMQSIDLQEGLDKLNNLNAVVIGISTDSLESHKKFAERYNLNFPLVADEDKKISELYGVLNERGRAKRVTFIIDENGIIQHIFTKVNVKAHTDEILQVIK